MDTNLFVRGVKLDEAFNIESQGNAYPYSIPAVQSLIDELKIHKPLTIIVGENGSGKSTLIEALAVSLGFNAEGGSKNFNFSTEETHSGLHKNIVAVKGMRRPKDGFFLRAESYYNVASNIQQLDEDPSGGAPTIGAYGGTSLHEQSHGESFMSLVKNRFHGNGLYILDEPESALSPQRQLELLVCLKRLLGDESQVIMATHSPLLMAFPDACLLELSEFGREELNLEETAHYQLYETFFSDPYRLLNRLLSLS